MAATKQTSQEVSSQAGLLLQQGKPEWMAEDYWLLLKPILGSCISQDETPAGDEITEADRAPWTPQEREQLKRLSGDAWGEPESQREDPLGR